MNSYIYKECERYTFKLLKDKDGSLQESLLFIATLARRKKFDLNFSYVDKGFHIVARPEAPSDAMIGSIMITIGNLDLHPSGIGRSVILSNRGQGPILNQITIDVQ